MAQFRAMAELITHCATGKADLDTVRSLCWEYRDHLIAHSDRERRVVEAFYPIASYTDLMDRLAELYAAPLGAILLARLDGKAVGCGMFHCILPRMAEIKRLYVQPAARGNGVGRMLCEGLMDTARTAGFNRVVLNTSKSLASARALYAKLNFTECSPFYTVPPKAEDLLCFYERPL